MSRAVVARSLQYPCRAGALTRPTCQSRRERLARQRMSPEQMSPAKGGDQRMPDPRRNRRRRTGDQGFILCDWWMGQGSLLSKCECVWFQSDRPRFSTTRGPGTNNIKGLREAANSSSSSPLDIRHVFCTSCWMEPESLAMRSRGRVATMVPTASEATQSEATQIVIGNGLR